MANAIIVPQSLSRGGSYQITGLTTGGGGGGTVVFDAAGYYNNVGNNNVTTQSFANALFNGGSFTVGSGANRALVAFLLFGGGNAGSASSPSLTWDGTSMTNLGGPYSNGTRGDIYIFGLVAPTSGAKVFAANWTGNAQAWVSAVAVSAADQTGGATTFHNITTNTGTSSLPTVATTIPSGEIAAAAFLSTTNFTTAGNTDIGHNNGYNAWALAADYTTSTGSQSLTYSPNGTFVAASICIKAA